MTQTGAPKDKFKSEADLPAEVYSAFYEQAASDPEGAMLYIANWVHKDVAAQAWDEGLADSINADLGSWDEPLSIPANPYRELR